MTASQSPSAVAKATIGAGLAAGTVMGLFLFVVTEPTIRRAIELEGSASSAAAYQPLVSRAVQEIMLIVGSSLFGVGIGMAVALVFLLVSRRLPVRSDAAPAFLAGTLWLSAGLLPFLKYPANPPGVGDPATMQYREAILAAFIAGSLLALVVAFSLHWLLGKGGPSAPKRGRKIVAVSTYVLLGILLLVFMPDNPDPITVPADLLWDFRIRSLFGQMLFWGVFAYGWTFLLRRCGRKAGCPSRHVGTGTEAATAGN